MIRKDVEKFSVLMAALSEAFSQPVSPQKIEIYFRALQDLDIREIEDACWYIINTRTTSTFPKIAEIRQAVSGQLEDQALMACLAVERAMQEVGAYQSVVFDDPVIHLVIDAFPGGWPGICSMPFEEWKFKRKEFIELYKTFKRGGGGNRRPPPKLCGIIEQTNFQRGLEEHIPEPVRISTGRKIERKQIA